MSEKLGDAILYLRTDDSGLDTGLAKGEAKAEASAAKLKRTGESMASVGAKLSMAMTLPLAALAAEAVPAAIESQQALGQVEAALTSMGPKAGRTSEQLQDLASHLQDISTFDDDDILKSVTSNMLTFGNVSGEAFDRAQLAAVNLSARLGQDLQSSAIQVGKALNDPVKGVTALQRVGVSFTESQKDQIKAMVEAGDVAGAQAIILGELEKQFAGAAEAQRKATPDAAMQQQWRTFQEVLGGIALKFLPPLTSAATSLLEGFNALSPGTQTFVAGLLATAAAAGPLLMITGGLVTGVGRLLPVLTSLGPAFTILEGGFRVAISLLPNLGRALMVLGANPVFLTIAALVAGVYLAWQNWEKIKPIIDAVGAAVSQWWNGNVQPIIDAVAPKIKELVGIFQEYFGKQIGNVIKLVTALFNGDFRGAWNAMQSIVSTAINAAWKVFQTFAPNVAGTLKAMAQQMVTSGREIIQGLVNGISANAQAVWNALKSVVLSGINKIRDFLGIRSPSLLFKEMGGHITDGLALGILSGLPAVEEAMDTLGKAVADTSSWTVDIEPPNIDFQVPDRAPTRSRTAGRESQGKSGGKEELDPATENSWREGFQRTFSDGVKAALKGDFGSFFSNFIDNMFSRTLDNVLNSIGGSLADMIGGLLGGAGGGAGGGIGGLLGGLFGGGGSAGGMGGILSSIFAGGFATGGMVPTGKFAIVGEKGPEPIISTPRGALVRPNSSMSSGNMRPATPSVTLNIPINAAGADPAALERVRDSIDRLRSDLPSLAVGAVQEAGERGIMATGKWR